MRLRQITLIISVLSTTLLFQNCAPAVFGAKGSNSDSVKGSFVPLDVPPGDDNPPMDNPPSNNPPGDLPPGDNPPSNNPPNDNPPGGMPPGEVPPTNNPPMDNPPPKSDDDSSDDKSSDGDSDSNSKDHDSASHDSKSHDDSDKVAVCILGGHGKSVKLGIQGDELAGVKSSSKIACISERACNDLIPQLFPVKGPAERGLCKHNPNVQILTDAQVVDLIQKAMAP